MAETDTNCIFGSSALGKRNERIEETGKRAAEELITTIKEGACVDVHSQDQIIVFMALAKGPSRVRVGNITLHTKTAIFVVEKLTKVGMSYSVTPTNSQKPFIYLLTWRLTILYY